jgi:hypothetical protein
MGVELFPVESQLRFEFETLSQVLNNVRSEELLHEGVVGVAILQDVQQLSVKEEEADPPLIVEKDGVLVLLVDVVKQLVDVKPDQVVDLPRDVVYFVVHDQGHVLEQ